MQYSLINLLGNGYTSSRKIWLELIKIYSTNPPDPVTKDIMIILEYKDFSMTCKTNMSKYISKISLQKLESLLKL